MNIKGIELLRQLKLPGPRKEQIFHDIFSVNIDELYKGAVSGATLFVFDYSEPITQNPLYEKEIHKYGIQKIDFISEYHRLKKKMLAKGVKRENIIFICDQAYSPKDILCSGRISLHLDSEGNGNLMIDAVESLRKANTDFLSSYVYQCLVIEFRMLRSKENILRNNYILPIEIFNKLIYDIFRITGNPSVDFEVYLDDKSLFYHDLFLEE